MWRLLVISMITAGVCSYAHAQAIEPQTPAEPQTPTVLILRFETPGDGADWIGRAAQEDLASELTRNTTARIKAPFESRPTPDLDSALKRAKEARATHVVFGQAQSMEGMVRISGQVVDVESKKPLGTLKITGPRASLFDLEDALARQVCAVLPQDSLKPDTLRALQENPPSPAIRLDDLEPEPIRVFPPYASEDYSVPERYDTAPIIVINVSTPSFDDVIPAYTWPAYGYTPYGSLYQPMAYSSPFYGYPYAWYGTGSYFGYPWAFNGGVVVVNGGFNNIRHRVMHHRGSGSGPWRGGGGQFAHGGFNGANGSNGGNGFSGGNSGVAVEFSMPGQPFFQGIPANGFRPAVPAGGFSVGIPQTGFTVGPRMGPQGMFRGPAFNSGGIRGGSAVR